MLILFAPSHVYFGVLENGFAFVGAGAREQAELFSFPLKVSQDLSRPERVSSVLTSAHGSAPLLGGRLQMFAVQPEIHVSRMLTLSTERGWCYSKRFVCVSVG